MKLRYDAGANVKIPMMPKGVEHEFKTRGDVENHEGEDSNDAERR